MGKYLTGFLLIATFSSFLGRFVPPPVLTPSSITVNEAGYAVLSWQGDLWLGQLQNGTDWAIPAAWQRLTQSSAVERDPVWHPDGKQLYFASDEKGRFDIWKAELSVAGRLENRTIVIESSEADMQPTFAENGAMAWSRGTGARSDIWTRSQTGELSQLTSTFGPDHSPAYHPGGTQISYVSERKGANSVLMMELSNKKKSTILSGKAALFLQWSPDGELLTFTTRNQPQGLWVMDKTGSYCNLLSKRRGIGTWSADGKQLLVMEIPRNPPAYNGDPMLNGDRPLLVPIQQQLQIELLPAPKALLAQATTTVTLAPADSLQFVQRLAQTVSFLSKRYGLDQGKNAGKWNRMVKASQSKMAKAQNEAEAEQILYELIKERPSIKEELKGKAAISSAHPLATAAGLEILEAGGNVVDAAVAVSFALGVVEPDASGVGGYGEMLVHLKEMPAPTCIEFLTRVPEAASLSNGLLQQLPSSGPVLVNVPGTVAGMELAWKRYGSGEITWDKLLEPAIRLARRGFAIDHSFATTLAMEEEAYTKCSRCQDLFFKNGRPLQAGDTLKNPDLAYTLRMIAYRGKDGFYKGPVAQRMVEDLRSKGNVITMEDMARYYAVERAVVGTTYRGHTVYSGPPPVSGGALLTAKLNLLEAFPEPKNYVEDAGTAHAMIEAWKFSPSGRGRIADPGLWPVDLKPFTDKPMASNRWRECFDPLNSAHPADSSCLDTRVVASWGAEGVLEARRSTGTTAFAVADGDGNMVSVTQTLGTWGGNFYVTPGLGFIYNDKLRSYNSNPKRYNARIPFARNVTSISPTMIFKGTAEQKQPLAALGAAGNAWITSAVYQMTTGIIDQGLGPQAALELPRFLVGMRRDPRDRSKVQEIVVQMEDGFAPGLLEQLETLGHELQLISTRGELRMGYGAAVIVEKGKVRAGADPRRSGAAGVIK
ncbi:MAG: gamma-glutamyltransferase [Saprospiraceae bacterium]|nr:gamma-glutamyltransferase [Saprospiraceae bacterium]